MVNSPYDDGNNMYYTFIISIIKYISENIQPGLNLLTGGFFMKDKIIDYFMEYPIYKKKLDTIKDGNEWYLEISFKIIEYAQKKI